MEKNNSEVLRVHKNFKKRVDKFIEDHFKIRGIVISTTQATKIIDDKIQSKGGLVP